MAVTYYKLIMFINTPPNGFSETFYWGLEDGTDSDVRKDASALWAARRPLLGNDGYLKAIRVTDITGIVAADAAGNVRPYPNPSFLLGEEQLTGSMEGGADAFVGDAWSAFLTDIYNIDFTVRRSFEMRGLPKKWHVWDQVDEVSPKLPPSMRTALVRFFDFLVNHTAGGLPNPDSRWRFLSRRTGTTEPDQIFPVDEIDVLSSEDRRWKLTVASDMDVDDGDMVHVHKASGCTLKGLNGDTKVDEILRHDPEDGFMDLILHKRQCCIGPVEYDGNASIYRVRKIVLPSMSVYQLGRTANRKTGKRSGGTRGRQRKRCCR